MDYRALSQMELSPQPFPTVQHEFRIFIEEKAFDRICSSANTVREVGGILVGEALRDESGPFIWVDAIIEALHAEESGTELTITHATWNHIHQQMDNTYAGKRIIGWYHTHPDFGIFLSERDRFIQQSFFDLPFQIALVYDPVRREHGIFAWRENKLWRTRQYWIGAQEHIWDGDRDSPDQSAKRGKPLNAESKDLSPVAAAEPVTQLPFGDLIGNAWVTGALLIGILIGLGLGLTWGKWDKGDTTTNAQTTQDAVSSLNTDLLAVIRETLSDEAFAKTFDEGIGRLDHASESLKSLNITDPAMKSAMQSVVEAQQSLSRARQDRLVAHEMLQQIDQIIRSNRTPEFVARDLADQRAGLAGVYVELARDAARNKDGPRVNELMKIAMGADPAHQAIYQQQLQSFEKEGNLPQATGDNGPAATPVKASPSPKTGG